MKTFVTAALLLSAPILVSAQDVISAQAGMINRIEGRVLIKDELLFDHPALIRHIEAGQHLRTDGGRAEVLFAVGTYLWLADNAEIEMVSAGLTSAKLRLLRGSMIVESQGVWDEDALTVVVGDAEIKIIERGIYRFDVRGTEGSTLRVANGRVMLVSAGTERLVKKKTAIRFGGPIGETSETPFKRWEEDELTAWHAQRSSVVAEATMKPDADKTPTNNRVLLDLPDRGRAGLPNVVLPFQPSR